MTHPSTGRVVVGVDGSRTASRALGYAAQEAAMRGLPLEIIHAAGQPADRAVPPAAIAADAAELALAHRPGIPVHTRITGQPAAEALLAAGKGATLLVLGSRGSGRLAARLNGSVSLAVAAHTPCPLLVVRGPEPISAPEIDPDRRSVVVGVRSPYCAPIVEAAFNEASLRHRRLCVLGAWTSAASTPAPVARRSPTPEAGTVLAAEPGVVLAERMSDMLEGVLTGPRERYPWVECRTRVVRDAGARALVRASLTADLLVIGAHRRPGRLGPRVGRAGHAVLHHSHAPVLLVPVG